MRLFLFILIVFGSLEIRGYPIVDVLLLSCFLTGVMLGGRTATIRINAVLIFCIYILLQVVRGMYVLNDYRMVYWMLFFVVLYSAPVSYTHLTLPTIYSV